MPQVHEGDCYLLALDLLQQHAATLGAAAIAVTCLMVSSLPSLIIMMFMNMCLMVVSFLRILSSRLSYEPYHAVRYNVIQES